MVYEPWQFFSYRAAQVKQNGAVSFQGTGSEAKYLRKFLLTVTRDAHLLGPFDTLGHALFFE